MSVTLDEVMMVANNVGLDEEKYKTLVSELEALEAEKKEERANSKKKNKSQLVVVVKGAPKDCEIVSHIFQIDAEEDPNTLIDKVRAASIEHNINCKKKVNKVESFDDIVHVKRKYSKEQKYMLKTRHDWVHTILAPDDDKFIEVPKE